MSETYIAQRPTWSWGNWYGLIDYTEQHDAQCDCCQAVASLKYLGQSGFVGGPRIVCDECGEVFYSDAGSKPLIFTLLKFLALLAALVGWFFIDHHALFMWESSIGEVMNAGFTLSAALIATAWLVGLWGRIRYDRSARRILRCIDVMRR